MRILRTIVLQIGRHCIVYGFHFHGYSGFLRICHLRLLYSCHNRVLRYCIGQSELIQSCLILRDPQLESTVTCCVLSVQVGEVHLLLLQLCVLSDVDAELCELLVGFPLAVDIQRDLLLLLHSHCACDVRCADVELCVIVQLVDEHLFDDCTV